MGNLQEAVSVPFRRREIPSITQQTPWPVRFVDFGKAVTPGVRFFNTAIYEHGGKLWMFARKATGAGEWRDRKNCIVAFLLGEHLQPTAYVEVGLTNRSYVDQHFEDPRITTILGRPWLSYCTFQTIGTKHYSGAHQQVAILGDHWQPQSVWDPVYGGNGGSISMVDRPQKNWTWFEHHEKPHLIYNIQPHEVVEWNGQEPGTVYETKCPIWKHGHKRGGSSPVRVGDEYFCFFHSSTPWKGEKRRYHMGAYAFLARPPFPITRITPKPILSGSIDDPPGADFLSQVDADGNPPLPLVTFPCGAVLQGKKWIVTLGVNDYCTALMEIPHHELEPLLK